RKQHAEEATASGGICSAMWQPPKAVSLVAGHGEGLTEINAFDRALQDARVADINFLRVTSIFPPGAKLIELPSYPAGLLLPAVYARIASTRPGDRISAAIAAGIADQGAADITSAFQVTRRLHQEQTPYQYLEVYDSRRFGRMLLLDGAVQTSEGDEFIYHEMLAHPPLCTHPAPRRVLIIGGG